MTDPVLDLLRARLVGARPGGPSEPQRLALAVEGGGMRGIVSAAMLCALEDMGATSVFDRVYASSAGALAAAAFLTGASWKSLALFSEGRLDRSFINPTRMLLRRPIMDVDYLFDGVIDRYYPLDWAELARGRRLAVDVTFLDSHSSECITSFESGADLRAALVASCWRPFESGGATSYRGRPAVDGSTLRPSPFRSAIEDGSSHILVLSTVPEGRLSARPTILQRLAMNKLERLSPGMGELYAAAVDRKMLDYREMISGRIVDGVAVTDVRPAAGEAKVGNWETDMRTLMTAARSAYARMVSAVRGDDPTAARDRRIVLQLRDVSAELS